ncbi:MAG: AAA family ATPase [Candidatus Diapherotrites archaeon]|nr:AAA family ATPase [Candidatus Diapherotrites archaeon]
MRITTGIKGFDDKIEGGYPENTVILVSGNTGTGKTLFGLSFVMEGARKKEKCVYVSLSETEDELLRACDRIDSLKDARKYVGKNLSIEYILLEEMLDLEYFIKLFENYPEVDRIVIDNINKLLIFAETKREFRTRLVELIKHLKNKSKCSLLLCETLDDTLDTQNGEAYECDGVVNLSFLEFEEKPRRILKLYKMRYTAFEERMPYEWRITEGGLELTERKVL